MIGQFDEFVLNYTLQQLRKDVNDHRQEAALYFTSNDQNLLVIDERLDSLESSESTIQGSIHTLKNQVEDLQETLAETIHELNKTKMVNIKQELVVRTLHNLKFFEAHDMYADTFSTGDYIDWEQSIRAELLSEFQSIGRTRKSVVEIEQTIKETYMIVAKNGSDDEAFAQVFRIEKAKQVDKVSIYIERANDDTAFPLTVSIRESLGGLILTSRDVVATEATGHWVEVNLPDYLLQAHTDYFLEVRTKDPYGYKVGVSLTDHYLPGTVYGFYGGNWIDNNIDLCFKIWCFPSIDENDATVYTLPRVLPTQPESIVFETEDTYVDGGINYFVSRNNGLHWKILQPGIETDLNDLPEGNTIVIKGFIQGLSRIDAWGYVIKRSDTV